MLSVQFFVAPKVINFGGKDWVIIKVLAGENKHYAKRKGLAGLYLGVIVLVK
jgi:hypothetical protein